MDWVSRMTAVVRPLYTRLTLAVAFTVMLALSSGCKSQPRNDRSTVSQAVEARFSANLGPVEAERSERVIIPPGIGDGRPLTEEQAVALALWNNAAFREALVELDLTRADLIQAGLLPNPEFLYYWAEPNKFFRYLFDFPLESLWLRPFRLKAAAAENDRAGQRLTQLALDLIRDTRLAYADLQLAQDRLRVAERSLAIRENILVLAEARLKAGDASPLEVSTARVDALRSAQDLTPVRFDVTLAQERLRNLMGISDTTFPLIPEESRFDPRTNASVEELVAEAVVNRPDAVAANFAAEAARERVRVSRLVWFRVLGIGDATTGTITDHVFGPAVRFTIPIFNQGQGGIARAKAEFEQLDLRRQTIHNQIVLDVRAAHARFQQVRAEMDFLQKKTRPEMEVALRTAQTAYKEGNVTYLIVLELNQQLITTYVREALLYADLRRSWAELERSIGRHLER